MVAPSAAAATCSGVPEAGEVGHEMHRDREADEAGKDHHGRQRRHAGLAELLRQPQLSSLLRPCCCRSQPPARQGKQQARQRGQDNGRAQRHVPTTPAKGLRDCLQCRRERQCPCTRPGGDDAQRQRGALRDAYGHRHGDRQQRARREARAERHVGSDEVPGFVHADQDQEADGEQEHANGHWQAHTITVDQHADERRAERRHHGADADTQRHPRARPVGRLGDGIHKHADGVDAAADEDEGDREARDHQRQRISYAATAGPRLGHGVPRGFRWVLLYWLRFTATTPTMMRASAAALRLVSGSPNQTTPMTAMRPVPRPDQTA